MNISARCAYGGTVPSGDEVRALDDTRVVVATPEALLGLFGADANFFRRVSLVICDEGHLLDGGARGVGLELLLARMRSREGGAPRFVFVSAIVPNIEEINAWLGGGADTVVRSDYRPALAEYAVLRGSGSGAALTVSLEMHPHEVPPTRFSVDAFLTRGDFQWINQDTGRRNTYPFTSMKTQAIASARKALAMGAVAVFAANKRGSQGAVGLAEELISQLSHALPMPVPADFVSATKVDAAVKYLEAEYGATWVGTRALASGAVLHHGDIPQETREVIEALLRHGDVRLAICTNTLAEGVDLPIRTLILYSVQRRHKGGLLETSGPRYQEFGWSCRASGSYHQGPCYLRERTAVASCRTGGPPDPGEPVHGALQSLVGRLREGLALQNITLTNAILDSTPELHTLRNGVDAALIDLTAEEIGEDALVAQAVLLADQTFASIQSDSVSKKLLHNVFELRARRVVGIRTAGRLGWIRETGHVLAS